jgi:fatty acid-binding protein DegV
MKIVTDSAADLPPSEAARLGVAVAPLLINFPEGEIRGPGIVGAAVVPMSLFADLL